MSVAVRLAGFAAGLAVVFLGALGIGHAVGPTHRAEQQAPAGHGMAQEDGASALPQGLSVAAGGYRLVPARTTFTAGRTQPFRFRIARDDGTTQRDFAVEHARRLHLIVVRRDLTRYLHVHPRQLADGSWTVPLRLGAAGTYRVFADFTPSGGERTTLGTDVTVPGTARPVPLPAPATTATTDGYDVALGHEGGELAFTVTRGGRPVDVQPYLGADGHLVVLREGDLAYLHAHPSEEGGSGPIRFMVEYPSAGSYRLFLQFRAAGRVHTAAFTQEVAR